jgi:DNA-binding winged helix-turn-helix (wHTH) protein
MTAGSSLKADVVRLRFDGFELDEADARLTRAGQPVPLPPRPFAVLCTLARSPHMLVTKDALLDSVWGHRFVTDSVLKTAVSEVRAALGDDPKEPRYVETVSRRGYRFIAMAAGVPSPQRVPVIERNSTGAPAHPGLAALTALCRGDAAIGNLIRAVAATLEYEQLVINDS